MIRRPTFVPDLILSSTPSPVRTRLEESVRSTYAAAYGAKVGHFLPLLLGLSDGTGALLGAVGAQLGSEPGRMFLESYLDGPVDGLLARAVALPVRRTDLAEVGNLAAAQPGAGLALMSTLAAYFDGAGVAWAVFTATDALRASFLRRGVALTDLGAADGRRLGAGLADWGRYYETDPRVTAVHIPLLRETLARDERLSACCGPVWDEALRQGRLHARDAA